MIEKLSKLKEELKKAIISQDEMIEALLIGLICEGHILIEGVPGLAKTSTISALAKVLGLKFKRVQFTPDLLPSDIIGAEIYNVKEGSFNIKHGPIFTNLLLADEINRAPAKVQSALLEAMAEKQVTIAEHSFKLNKPFFVMATQNPLEQEGVYPLPEAQLDRFMLKVLVKYNSKEDELLIARKISSGDNPKLNEILDEKDLIKIQEEVKNIHIDEEVQKYIIDLIDASRNPLGYGLEEIKDYISFGVSTRASIDMFKAAKAKAYFKRQRLCKPS